MKNQITFSYVESHDFENPLEITMEVPERSIDEMCQYFQRFLTAAGYIFDEGEYIQSVKKKKDEADYPGCGGDILTFNDDGTPFCYDFGDGSPTPLAFTTGIRGGMAKDILKP
jgi:hypothetical protein